MDTINLNEKSVESAKLLYKFFCNNIFLGQWELASLCARKIAKLQTGELATDVQHLLRDVAYYPYNRSLGLPPTILSCHHLSWLCLQECLKINTHIQAPLLDEADLTRNIEFRMLLMEIGDSSTTKTIQELYTLHFILWSKTEFLDEDQEGLLTPHLVEFVREILMSRPSLGHSLIRSLIASSNCYDNTRAILWHIYISVLEELLSLIADSRNSPSYEIIDKLYVLLATLDIPVCCDLKKRLKATFTRIIDLCRNDAVLSKHKIMSCLLGHRDTVLINLFISLDREVTSQALLSHHIALNGDVLNGEGDNMFLSLLLSSDHHTRWNNFFHLCVMKKKHFLSVLVDICLELIRSMRYDFLPVVFSKTEFTPLKPMILLMGWNFCYTLVDARALLAVLHDPSSKSEQRRGLLQEGAENLSNYINIVSWCLDNTKDRRSTPMSMQHGMATELLQDPESTSILSVLHQSTKLSALDVNEVLSLLHRSNGHGDQANQKKSVRFVDANHEASPLDHMTTRQKVDLSIYHSYCAVVLVMEAIFFCEKGRPHFSPRNNYTADPERHSTSRESRSSLIREYSTSNSSLSAEQPQSSNVTTQKYSEEYNVNVTRNLTEAKSHLAQIFPLNYRLEVLENIFSLLFVTHESLREVEGDDESDSGALPEDASIVGSATDHGVVTLSVSVGSGGDVGSQCGYDEPFVENASPTTSSVTTSRPNAEGSNSQQLTSQENVEPKKRKSFTDGTKSSNCDSSQHRSGSTPSGSGSTDVHKLGFLANEFVSRDVIHLMKAAMLDLGTARVKLLSADKCEGNSQDTERSLMAVIACSIHDDTMQKRLTRLNHYVSEAHWRYQLVARSTVSPEAGEVTLIASNALSESDCDEIELNLPRPRRTVHRKMSKKANSGDSDAVTDGSHDSSHSRRSYTRSSHSTPSQLTHGGIVASMLSSHNSLLNLSLRRGHLIQATQVIKLFNLDKSHEAAEVRFAQLFQETCQKLQNCDIKPVEINTEPPNSRRADFQRLARIAAAGLAVSSVATVINEILDTAIIPAMLLPTNFALLPQFYKDIFDVDNCKSMIVLDLSMCTSNSWNMLSKLLEMAKSYLPRNRNTGAVSANKLPKAEKCRIAGYFGYMKWLESFICYALMSETSDATRSEKNLIKELLAGGQDSTFSGNVYPLKVAECERYVTTISVITRAVDKCEKAMSEFWSRLDGSPSGEFVAKVSDCQGDIPANHKAMQQLISVFEKHVPPGGILQLIYRTTQTGGVSNRNYLLSLYDHVKELATLVTETDPPIGAATRVVSQNYFRVLRQSPIAIIGNLMFAKKMPPSRLENVAKNLSLKLMHIIVHSCSPVVPSKYTKQTPPVHHDKVLLGKYGQVVLNGGGQWAGQARSPQQCVQSLLIHLIHIMKETTEKNNASGLFTDQCLREIACSPTFNDITVATQELRFINLSLLSSHEDRTCFFTNLHNLLVIHTWLYKTWHRLQLESSRDSMGGVQTDPMPMDLEELTLPSSVSYSIGQLGNISLADLRQYFCVSRKTINHKDLDQCDPWAPYTQHCDPRLVYVVSEGYATSPPLQVLSPDLLHSQLTTAMELYIDNTVSVDVERRHVTVPSLLMCHYNNYYKGTSAISHHTEALVNFLATLVTGKTQEELVDLLRIVENYHNDPSTSDSYPIKVTVTPSSHFFLYTFDYDTWKNTNCCIAKRRRSSSLSSCLKSLKSLKSTEMAVSYREPVKENVFHLTPVTLEYVKDRSSLVASLVSLICSDEMDDIEESFTDDHFTFRKLTRSISEISLVDIRSYRYSKLTNEYPALKRHLLNYVIPLAAADHPEIFNGDDPILKLMTSDINEKVKGCMLNHQRSQQFASCIFRLITELIERQKWLSVVLILQSLCDVTMETTQHLRLLHDCVLSRAIITALSGRDLSLRETGSKVIAPMLVRFYNKEQQSRMVLQYAGCLPMDVALDVVEMCIYDAAPSDKMKSALQTKLKELHVYKAVMAHMQTAYQRLVAATDSLSVIGEQTTTDTNLAQLQSFSDWSTLQQADASLVLSTLLSGKAFDVARNWARLKRLDDQQEIDKVFLLHVMSQDPPEFLQAFSILDGYLQSDVSSCVKLCHALLETTTNFLDVVFITNFMLRHVSHELTDEIRDKLRLLYIGGVFLQNIPEGLHATYSHLVSSPSLILEQLIMNTKVELAGQLYTNMKNEFDLVSDPNHRLSSAQFADLVAWYAGKALEFPVIQADDQDTDPNMGSGGSVSHDTRDNMSVSSFLPGASALHRYDSAKSIATRRYLDGRRSSLTASPGKNASTSLSPPASVISKPFIMPAEPPSRAQWVADSAVTVCMVCERERFSMFSRRHHCRRCGRVVCATCSNKTMAIKGISARTCDDCFNQMLKPRPNNSSQKRRPSETPGLEAAMSPTRFRSNSIISNIGEASASDLQKLLRHSEHEWKLNLSEEFNAIVREDFFYEQAPSAPLCISLMALLPDSHRAGHLMLKFCDDLSQILRSIAPGVPNPEVDYTLVISMMKHILLHAKMSFINNGGGGTTSGGVGETDGRGLSICDIFLDRIDLLYLLISSNVRDIPSLNELASLDVTRRLRDRLIEKERLPLAIEVSTKCGLDPAGVWSRWGMSCLEMQDYTGAREKFSRCLKVSLDRNLNVTTPKTLRMIVEYLENSSSETISDMTLLLSGSTPTKRLVSLPPPKYTEETSLSSPAIQECLYYLKLYGTHANMVNFYQKHGYLMKAAQYVLDHKCSSDTFIDQLLVPCLNQGHLAILQDQMLMIDVSLDRWAPYLTAACRYFMKAKLIHVLYEFQLFMKDFIRAAMTCITYFYTGGACSYHDLASRSHFLVDAKSHMESYLDPRQWGSVKQPSFPGVKTSRSPGWRKDEPRSPPDVRLLQSIEEVRRNITGVNTQIRVTEYLHKSLPPQDSDITPQAAPPTLFGNSKMRSDLVHLIMLKGNSLTYSFDLCLQISQLYKLSFVPVLVNVGHELAKRHEYAKIEELLSCLHNHSMDTDETVDNIVGSCIIVLADDTSQSKELDSLIMLLRSNSNKINALILCGKLRSAYLLAVRLDRTDDIRRIAGAAHRTGQTALKSICDKYLAVQTSPEKT